MENLADELVLDAAVKQAFFSASDVFFDIARWLQEIAQTAEAADATVTADDKNGKLSGASVAAKCSVGACVRGGELQQGTQYLIDR